MRTGMFKNYRVGFIEAIENTNYENKIMVVKVIEVCGRKPSSDNPLNHYNADYMLSLNVKKPVFLRMIEDNDIKAGDKVMVGFYVQSIKTSYGWENKMQLRSLDKLSADEWKALAIQIRHEQDNYDKNIFQLLNS
jgi:hypothetical protein